MVGTTNKSDSLPSVKAFVWYEVKFFLSKQAGSLEVRYSFGEIIHGNYFFCEDITTRKFEPTSLIKRSHGRFYVGHKRNYDQFYRPKCYTSNSNEI